MKKAEVQVLVPASIFQGALNYIRHVGANHVMRGEPHPQQWIVDGLELAASNRPDTPRTEAREKILEEAAKACESEAAVPSTLWEEPRCWMHAAENCAARIRALKSPPSPQNESQP